MALERDDTMLSTFHPIQTDFGLQFNYNLDLLCQNNLSDERYN